MGVQGLWKLLESTGRPVNPETLEGKILAVDISIWLNQAVKGARDRQGNAIQNAHLLTLFHRLCKLLFFRIRPIFVFDGEAPGLKKRTLAIRRQRKNAATQDSSKTTEKLLKTFLKRQAIKAVLTGKSDEVIPSLSQVRREEVDDIYMLPALQEPEKNSSDEEEEKEWEERMTQKQEEFLEDPHSVDIESEDFISLPPEVKHEILTDLKELTKRRRTIFETMPEESNDFSQYQLKGLLKKNTLNRHIHNVQKEMNQQSSGDIQALYENEGGFLKNVESRKVMSEDAAHYVLIKGLQSKKEVNQKDLSLSSSSTIGNDPPCKEVIHGISTGSQPPSLVKPDTEERTVDVAPPSPRTLLAIQTAMMESSSDEETVGENNISSVVCYKTEPVDLGVPHIGNSEGNLSHRTFHAIQQALTEEIDETFDGVGGTLSNMSNKDEINSPGSNVILITSSDEDDAVPISIAEEKITLTAGSSNSTCPKNIELDQRSSVIQRHILVNAEKSAANVAGEITAASVDSEVIEIKEQCSLDLKFRKDMEIKEHLDLECKSLTDKSHNKLTGAECTEKAVSLPIHITSLDSDDLKTEFHTKLLENNGALSNVLQTDKESLLPTHVVSVISGRNLMVEEEVNDEAIQSKESDSESDDGFIEVDSGLSDNSLDLSEPEKALTTAPATISHPPGEATPILDQDESVKELDDTNVDGSSDWVEPIQPEAEAAENHEAAVNEWHDISLEELETLESNLLVQQGTLQAQKQQQERIAATVTGQMYLESQELLRLFGVPYIVAPTEAEAQCAILDLTDQTSGTITDDSDIWLFGARHVYKNFFSHNKYVEYYQYVDIHNQLGLDRNKLINLAYLLGSDYTDGIPTVGCVTAMEILNEFPGHGLQPLIEFRNWWAEAQKNKKMRPNPNDTKVKKKLRELELHQAFPNLAVAEAYLKPIVDDGKGAFSWGRPDLEQIREFCATAFGWYRSKTDDILLPVLKQLNAQQTQLRIDSFFRMEQHEKHAIKSQRLRRAVICMQRKEREGEIPALEEAIPVIDEKFKSPEKKKGKRTVQDTTTRPNCETGKRKKASNSEMQNIHGQVGGFFDVSRIPENESGSSSADPADEPTNVCRGKQPLGTQKTINVCKKTAIKDKWKSGEDRNISSSSGEDEPEVKTVMVTARSVFENKAGKSKGVRGRKKKN